MTLWGSRVTFEVSSAAPEADPVWVNLTAYALKIEPITVRIGRQNDLDQSEPATLSVLLNNNDDRFTYGNTSSPYTSWWGPGRKCRLRETIGTTVLDIFVGYLQVPTETFVTPSKDQTVSVQAVDRLGRLAASEPFPSALGAYILGHADLVGYWPLTTPAPPLLGIGPSTAEMPLDTFRVSGSGAAGVAIAYGSGEAPPGGEGSSLSIVTGKSGSTVLSYGQLSYPLGFVFTMSTTDTVNFVAWCATTAVAYSGTLFASGIDGNGSSITLFVNINSSTGAWQLQALGAMTGTIDIGHVGDGALFPVGVRVDMTAASMELWVGGQRYTGALTGSVPTAPITVSTGHYAAGVDVDISHVQVYRGSTYSYSDFLAQISMGYTPLERQTTGDRIRTLASYADIPVAEYTSTVDPGTTVMQAASLAGKTPLDAMREAERTERGLLYANGSGQLVFEDRRSLYNV